MHEFSLAQEIFTVVLETAQKEKVEKVHSITLEVGKLMAVVTESLIFSFELLCEGTMLEGTKLLVQETPVRVRCKECGKEFELESYQFTCSFCGSKDLDVLSGKDMFIKSLEVDKDGRDNP